MYFRHLVFVLFFQVAFIVRSQVAEGRNAAETIISQCGTSFAEVAAQMNEMCSSKEQLLTAWNQV